jgi:hypothetical protein
MAAAVAHTGGAAGLILVLTWALVESRSSRKVPQVELGARGRSA